MSVLDAVCTLVHLENGAAEVNPFMDMLLLEGVSVFLTAKGLMTICGVLVLALHQNFRLSVPSLYVVAYGYAALTVYHGLLFLPGL